MLFSTALYDELILVIVIWSMSLSQLSSNVNLGFEASQYTPFNILHASVQNQLRDECM